MQPCEATSVAGFVSQVVQFITHGYYFYVGGDTKNDRGLAPAELDKKIVSKFTANLPSSTRAYRKKRGQCSVRYIRYGRHWFLFSTYGRGRFFDEHASKREGEPHQFLDIREVPIKFHGYSICLSRSGYERKTAEEKAEHRRRAAARRQAIAAGESFERLPRGRRHERWVGSVRIQQQKYLELEAEFLGMATHRRADYIAERFSYVPFEPYAPVRQQLRILLRKVNKARKHVGYDPVPVECLRTKRKHVAAFKPPEDSAACAAA